jgi:4-hydroxy-tetrahydrodipicolinate synthase
MPAPFRGVFTALVSPMTLDEELDLGALEAHVDRQVAAGVHGLVALGSTGEYYALSPAEREAVVRTVVGAARGRVPVLAGPNAGSTRDAVAYARQAEKAGAAGLLVSAPYYSLPTPDELVDHVRAVAESTGLPVMLYNYPGRAGVDMQPETVERLAEIPAVRYIKESTGEITRVSAIVRRCGARMTVFCGCDTEALESFALGATGWVTGAANFAPKPVVELFRLAADRQDLPAARAAHYRLLPLLAHLETCGRYTQAVKAGCAIAGHPVGPPRRPLRALEEGDVRALRDVVAPLLNG